MFIHSYWGPCSVATIWYLHAKNKAKIMQAGRNCLNSRAARFLILTCTQSWRATIQDKCSQTKLGVKSKKSKKNQQGFSSVDAKIVPQLSFLFLHFIIHSILPSYISIGVKGQVFIPASFYANNATVHFKKIICDPSMHCSSHVRQKDYLLPF